MLTRVRVPPASEISHESSLDEAEERLGVANVMEDFVASSATFPDGWRPVAMLPPPPPPPPMRDLKTRAREGRMTGAVFEQEPSLADHFLGGAVSF